MADPRIREFAQLVVQIRDEAIQAADRRLDPQAQSVIAKRWRRAGLAPAEIIPDVVDDTIAQFLYMIDEGLIRLQFTASDGSVLDLKEVGEGDLCASFGVDWKFELSTQRAADDDLAQMRKAIEDKYGPKGSAT